MVVKTGGSRTQRDVSLTVKMIRFCHVSPGENFIIVSTITLFYFKEINHDSEAVDLYYAFSASYIFKIIYLCIQKHVYGLPSSQIKSFQPYHFINNQFF